MIHDRSAFVLALLLLTGLVAGCTSTSAGEPQPGENTGDTASQTPTRPREIPLDNVDPCTLLPQADYPEYNLDKPGEPGQDDQGAADCSWFGDIGYMNVTLVTYEGVEAQEGREVQREPVDPIEGFPALESTLPGDEENACFVTVDVADGQYLQVQVGLYVDESEVGSVCEYAHRFASSVMSTLVKQ